MLLTSWFPPKQGVAVNRMVGFARYLEPSRTSLSVVTESVPGASDEDRFDSANVYRTASSGLLRKSVFKPGEPSFIHLLKVAWNVCLNRLTGAVEGGWMRNAESLLDKLHERQPVDIIISSYAPAAPHLVAGAFVAKHPEVKWIADMRDEMSLNPHFGDSERKKLAAAEKVVNAHADAVTTVSRPILDDFRRLLPAVRYFEEVRNGFDHDLESCFSFNPVFTIGYTGTFYGKNKPITFFKGLRQFLAQHPVPYELRFIGTNHNFEIPDLFRKHTVFLPRLDYADAIGAMANTDANLLVLPKVNRSGVFSGKLFDYLSVCKPIIAVVDPEDVAAQLIQELKAGFVADFDDVDAIAHAIEAAYDLWKNRTPIQSDKERIKLLHRRYEVGKLNRLIEQLSAG